MTAIVISLQQARARKAARRADRSVGPAVPRGALDRAFVALDRCPKNIGFRERAGVFHGSLADNVASLRPFLRKSGH